MPEGPEIRRAADLIADVLVDQRIQRASFAFSELRDFEDRLQGTRVRAIDTHGKAMLTRFENQLTLYSHNQLYGRWYTMPRGQFPETRRSLRVALHTATHSALLYSASDIRILTQRQLEAHPFLSRLGPDILDKNLQADDIVERLGQRRFLRRSLASLYLDQGFLAGLGNYLRSEILYCSDLHPQARPADLDLSEQKDLARETLRICWRSYRTGGVTLGREQSHREGERFWVFARASKPCYRCGAKIRRENFSGRRLYYCPACQAPPQS